MLGLTMKTMQRPMGELELIESIRAAGTARRVSRNSALRLGIGDDCAILRPPNGHEILVTTDFTLEGRHFRRQWHPAQSVGHRALARGLSDLAAMGATPQAAFLSLALPPDMLSTRDGRKWVTQFFAGLRGLAGQHKVPLAGGDTSESPCGLVLADIVLVGSAPAGRALRRAGGRAGDGLYVTGSLGGSAAELATLEHAPSKERRAKSHSQSSEHPQLYPQPRIGVGLALLGRHLATAAIDLSDGLSTDLAHLCHESGVGVEVRQAALPIHPLAAKFGPVRAHDLALNGGEDYELLFSAPSTVRMPRTIAGVRITRIGSLVRGQAVTLIDSAGKSRKLSPGGWEHFKPKH